MSIKTFIKEIIVAVIMTLLGTAIAAIHIPFISGVLIIAGHYNLVKTVLVFVRGNKGQFNSDALQDASAYVVCACRKFARAFKDRTAS